MKFAVASSLLDACVLGTISSGAAYGYILTQKIQNTINVSESTLYPVLRRLLKDGLLHTYDEPYDGRNRRYYSITEKGRTALTEYTEDWHIYKLNVENLILGRETA